MITHLLQALTVTNLGNQIKTSGPYAVGSHNVDWQAIYIKPLAKRLQEALGGPYQTRVAHL